MSAVSILLRCFLFFFFASVAVGAFAQTREAVQIRDTLPPLLPGDTSLSVKKKNVFVRLFRREDTDSTRKQGSLYRFFAHNYPDPRKAALFSLIPGGGQVYNKRLWKVPIVWGVIGGLGVAQYKTTAIYKDLSTAYREKVNGRPVFNTRYATLGERSLKGYRDQYRRYTESLWLGIFLSYALSASEAYVDAHLRNFDVDDALTLRPVIAPGVGTGAAPVAGIGVCISFGK